MRCRRSPQTSPCPDLQAAQLPEKDRAVVRHRPVLNRLHRRQCLFGEFTRVARWFVRHGSPRSDFYDQALVSKREGPARDFHSESTHWLLQSARRARNPRVLFSKAMIEAFVSVICSSALNPMAPQYRMLAFSDFKFWIKSVGFARPTCSAASIIFSN